MGGRVGVAGRAGGVEQLLAADGCGGQADYAPPGADGGARAHGGRTGGGCGGQQVIELLIASLPDWTRLHEWTDGSQILPHMIAVAELGIQLDWETERLALLCNWTGYYLDHLGAYAEARPFYERALAIRETQLGPDHPSTATSLNNLGELHRAMGAYAEARPFYERALAIKETQLGPDHPDTATSLNDLAGLFKAIGEYEKALPMRERVLEIYENKPGKEHPWTATSLNNLGALLESMGAYSGGTAVL